MYRTIERVRLDKFTNREPLTVAELHLKFARKKVKTNEGRGVSKNNRAVFNSFIYAYIIHDVYTRAPTTNNNEY